MPAPFASSGMQPIDGIQAWHRANALCVEIRRASRTWRRQGYSTLVTQTTRAAESIGMNIAEGAGTQTRKEFARFLDMAIRSASEVESQLRLAREYGVLHHDHWRGLSNEAVEIRKMIFGFRRSLLRVDAEEQALRKAEKARSRPARKRGPSADSKRDANRKPDRPSALDPPRKVPPNVPD